MGYRGDMRFALVLGLLCTGLLACGDDDTDGREPDASVAVDGGTTGGCVTDDDCRRFSSTCDGCEYLPLLASDPDPVCEGMTVSCLIDPCETAGAARCDVGTGNCELE